MRLMVAFLLALGVVLVLIGLLWMGQGSGYFPYPRASFMIDQRPWLIRGLIAAIIGLIAIFISRRLRA